MSVSNKEDNPYRDFEINLDTIETLNNTFENIKTVELLAQQGKILSEQGKTFSEKCAKLPRIIFKSTCVILVLGLIFTWLIFTLVSSKSSMYSKKWSGEALLAHTCYEMKKSCNSTYVCEAYDKCMHDNEVFKTSWLKDNEINYGDKVQNIFEGATMYNNEGGSIYGSFVVYIFMTVSLFLILLVVIYKLFYGQFFS